MNQETTTKIKRSGELDILRFLAVLIVFLAHFTDTFNQVYQIVPENLKYAPIFRYGPVALSLFFIISGYVVTMTSIKRNIREFTITRLSRIYPLFWVSCIIAFLLPRIFATHSYLAFTSVKTFLANLTMLAPIFGQPMINPVFHTLIVELLFYFFIGITIYFKLWNRILTVIAIMFGLCIINSFFADQGLQTFFPAFAAGMLFYFLKIGYGKKWIIFILLLIAIAISVYTGKVLSLDIERLYNDNIQFKLPVYMTVIVVVFILFYFISRGKIHIKNYPLFQILGEIAYPFYLFHIYFLVFYWYFRDKVQADLLLFGIAIAITLVSWVLNVYVEKPLSKLTAKTLTKIIINSPFRKAPNHTAPGF
jgi:peptidoglycan/LPS O-acetylase OafA/YrhL